jgi:uncharacterized spore protein YtfJ
MAAAVQMEPTLLERIAQSIHADAKQVYGEPVERDGTTIIPVARVQWGFGGGGLGRGAGERGGGGGGARATPAGYIELRDGTSRYRPIIDTSLAALVVTGALGVLAGILISRPRR